MKNKKNTPTKAVVYNKKKKSLYIDNLKKCREMRVINVQIMKSDVIELNINIKRVESEINNLCENINAMNMDKVLARKVFPEWRCKKNIVGFDVVELAPKKGEVSASFNTAKLIYKFINYVL